MIKVKKQALKSNRNFSAAGDESVAAETTVAENQKPAASADEKASFAGRDFSDVFARLKRSVRKKSVSIF